MPRPRLKFFVDRESEIEDISSILLSGGNVLLLGLRGYGKSALSGKIVDILENRGVKTLYINCLKIINPDSLFEEAERDCSLIGRADEFRFSRGLDARVTLDVFFNTIMEKGVQVLVLDEITALLKRFGEFKPFSSIGGAEAVVGYIRDYIESSKLGVLASDTSIGAIYELILNYSSPLLKSFHKVVFLDPLKVPDAANLLMIVMERRNKKINKKVAWNVAQQMFGVPQYIIFIGYALPNNPSMDIAREVIIEEFLSGTLNVYFELFLEKFSYEQKAILYAIGRGAKTYSAISKRSSRSAGRYAP